MRIKLMTLCMALCCLCSNSFAQNVPDYVPSDGLVAWYPFNGDANDESEFANNGVVNGATLTTDRFGTINSAYLFDGLDDFIRSTSVISNVDTVSMSMWVHLNSNEGGSFIHIGHDSGNPICDGFGLGNGGATYYGEGLNLITLSSCVSWINSTFDLTVSNWFHLVFVKENLSGSYYLDGDFLGSQNLIAINQPSDSVYFGNVNDSGSLSLNGKLDDVGIWNRALTEEEILAIYNAQLPVPGCTDVLACNYNEDANEDDASCIYPLFGDDCQDGGAACGEGTIWDANIQSCIVSEFCQEDLDGDGAIGINDLLQLLPAFGTMCEDPETGEFTCGDPMNYHGYDYATVQIGEQCWFAENLRTELYQNGDSLIPATQGGMGCWLSDEYSVGWTGDYCDVNFDSTNFGVFGYGYNWLCIDAAELCPINWHVSTDLDFQILEIFIGMDTTEASSFAYAGNGRGSGLGGYLLSEDWTVSDWPASTPSSGLDIIPTGTADRCAGWIAVLERSYLWTSSFLSEGNGIARTIYFYIDDIGRVESSHDNWHHVRCLKDTEE